VYGLADWGLWAQGLFRAIRQGGWHPLMRLNAQGQFRGRWQRQAPPLAAFAPTQGQQVAVDGFAFQYGLRCTLVVYWGASAQEPWYLLTDLPASAVEGAWYGLRGWIEQGFRHWKRGGWAWHRTRVVDSERVFVSWLVYALAQLVVLVLGVWAQERLCLWDWARRRLGVYRLGRLVVQVWLLWLLGWEVGQRLGLEAGGELK